MIRVVETFAIFVTFAVHKEWAHCWRKIYGAGHARNKSLYAVESMAVEAMFAMSSDTGHKGQRCGVHAVTGNGLEISGCDSHLGSC